MSYLNQAQIRSLASTAASAAAYLDTCDNGAQFARLDPAYYQACARVLTTIFAVVDVQDAFPDLLSQSPAARNMPADGTPDPQQLRRLLPATGRHPATRRRLGARTSLPPVQGRQA